MPEKKTEQRLRITLGQVAAFNAMKSSQGAPEIPEMDLEEEKSGNEEWGVLEKYVRKDAMVIPLEVVQRLPPGKVRALISIIEAAEGKGLEKKVVSKTVTLSPAEIKAVIIEDKRNGYANKEIYQDPRLEGVNPGSIAAYLAHLSRGSYK